MGRIGRDIAASTALVVLFLGVSPRPAHCAAPVIVAQANAPGGPAVSAPDVSGAGRQNPAPQSASAPEPASKAKAAKTALAVPACSMRYVAAKISGKLNGRKWGDFRREECGEEDTQAVFPSAIAPKHSGENPDKARTLTCADQFTANKATNANGGLKWIDKDGGYYTECVIRLQN